ncbi:hypothetical protein KDW55_02185 [Burkholderia sp. AU19243]|uniref:hypothetical protein n=1 Tax=Burkholderia sp. AU19243 TaxID=2824810 RepID=UPI001B98C028|nr:hypothetical protein [Burkholderia sp. AU19243]MBR8362126.1 hypothetical protein [Burkholderia sp. AU19243]
MIDQDTMRFMATRLRAMQLTTCDEAADAIDALLAEVEAIEQAILDPENQPSQYGTVLLESARKESDSLMSALAECREAMPHRDSCDAELMQAIGDPGAVPIYVKAVVATLRAELEAAAADKRDADRYRWLRDDNAYAPEEACIKGGADLDELCDDGIALAQRQGEGS